VSQGVIRAKIYSAVDLEVTWARKFFPSPNFLTTAMAEEAGEALKAIMDHMQKGGSKDQIRKELIQTMAMCVRLLEEGDPIHNLNPPGLV
jgi:predicted small metal-binding protein